MSGAKSARGDAATLADTVRTDRHHHRSVAGDTEEAQAVEVLARAHQHLIWDRQRHVNRCAAGLLPRRARRVRHRLAEADSATSLRAPTSWRLLEATGLLTLHKSGEIPRVPVNLTDASVTL